jgi:ABC-type Na+ transport system ATPase subunit NatA
MQEVAALADELVIIAHGRVATRGAPAKLMADFGTDDLEQVFVDAVAQVSQ